MNKSLIAAVVLLLGSASQALAAGVCPTRSPGESVPSFRDRTHNYCEVHWQALLSIPGGPGQTHDSYINLCSKTCYKAVSSQSAQNLGAQNLGAQNLGAQFAGNQIGLLGGLATAGAVAGVGASAASGSGAPASP